MRRQRFPWNACKKYMVGLLACCLVLLLQVPLAHLHRAGLYKIYQGWRARRKMGSKTFNGPIRHTEAAANEDALLLEEAAAVSIERLQEVHDRLTSELHASVAKHRSGWRVRVTVGREKICCPTRQGKGEAEEDCLRLRGLQHMSTAELQNAVANLHQQVAEVGAARDREVRFKEVALAEMRNCLALQQPGKCGL